MVKVITGIRRCGKSYLLFTLFRRHLLAQGVDEQHIIALALDDMLNEEYRNPKALYQYVLDRVADIKCIMSSWMRYNWLKASRQY